MLTHLRIENFRVIRHLDFDLEPLTVIVGPNGSGKSTALSAIELLDDVTEPVPLPHDLSGVDNRQFLRIEVEINRRLRLWFGGKTPGNDEWIQSRGDGWVEFLPRNDEPFSREELEIHAKRLQLDPRALAQPNPVSEIVSAIDDRGNGLATIIATLASENPELSERIQSEVRELLPAIRRLRSVRVKIDGLIADTLLVDFKSGVSVPAHSLSHGTLLVIGLVVILNTAGVKVLMLDDLEAALHPSLQQQVVGYLRSILERTTGLQVIATSHSPYILDAFRPEEVRIMTLDDEGWGVGGKLTDHPDFARWKDEMAPGEMWSVFGEKWLTGSSSPQVAAP